jgi:hypothetical protein
MSTAVISRFMVFELLVAVGLAMPSVAQQSQPAQPGTLGTSKSKNGDPLDPNNSMAMRMARERNVIRQKQIVADTNQLLLLAHQLNESVNKSNSDQLSVDVVKTAGQIQKLAKSIKDKMREESGTPCVFFDQPGCIANPNPTQLVP